MKTYKLLYKDENDKLLLTMNLLASNVEEAFSKCKVLLENCLDKRVKKVELSKD
jgi:hypothetical protein